ASAARWIIRCWRASRGASGCSRIRTGASTSPLARSGTGVAYTSLMKAKGRPDAHAGTEPVSPFVPPWWLRNPHVQTLYAACLKPLPRIAWRRERWPTPDGDFVDLDWLVPD